MVVQVLISDKVELLLRKVSKAYQIYFLMPNVFGCKFSVASDTLSEAKYL
jgi:hypothetical protein